MTTYYRRAIIGPGPCFWCEKLFDPIHLTRDHLIPVWAGRLFRTELGYPHAPGNIVKSCGPCNAAKGGMPPETFYRVRTDPQLRKVQQTYWHQLQDDLLQAWNKPHTGIDPAMRKFVVAQMLRPIPGYEPPPEVKTLLEEELDREFQVNPPHSKNSPLRRLTGFNKDDVDMLNKVYRPGRYSVGSVPENTVLKNEDLNGNLKGTTR